MRESTIDDLIKDLRAIDEDKAPKIPYQLHDGIRQLIQAFINAGLAANFIEQYRNERRADEDGTE